MKLLNTFVSLTLANLLFCTSVQAHENHSSNAVSTPSSHAPIGVMGDHLHKQGEWMMSYRYMHMKMDGNRIGSDRVSARSIVGTMMNPGQFMVAPSSMPMEMHMVGAMYGYSDSLTIMAMTNFVSQEMDHLIRNGNTFTTESSGWGDTSVSALLGLIDTPTRKLHAQIGLSLPTGSIDERDDTPAMQDAFLPYPMQLGSGTYDINMAVSYTAKRESLNWGAQARGIFRTGVSDEGYTLGDRAELTAWLAKDLNQMLSASARLLFASQGRIDGANPVLNPMMIQTANTQLQGGHRVDLLLGVNVLLANGHRLALEYGVPLDQDLNGPQLETDSVLTLGWQKAF